MAQRDGFGPPGGAGGELHEGRRFLGCGACGLAGEPDGDECAGEQHLVGKLDAIADRKASVLNVNALHEDVSFTSAMTTAVRKEVADLAAWLGLGSISGPARARAGRG